MPPSGTAYRAAGQKIALIPMGLKSGFMLEYMRRRECLCLTVFNMSKNDKYGKLSNRLDLITQDNKYCLGSLSLQTIGSISEALDLRDLVGT